LLRRHAPTAGLGAVLLVLLYLSLNHLANGVQIVTGCGPWEATAMAIGLDLLLIPCGRVRARPFLFSNYLLTRLSWNN
jgi:hypothetical protein